VKIKSLSLTFFFLLKNGCVPFQNDSDSPWRILVNKMFETTDEVFPPRWQPLASIFSLYQKLFKFWSHKK